jgi:ABC-type multidrug transport system ATPase subunit
VLWGDLTVEDHLYFYARLKGVSPDKEDEKVTKAIEEVLL